MPDDTEHVQLWARYLEATGELMNAQRAYFQACAAELEAKLNTYFARPGSSHAERERTADHAALVFSSEKLGLKGEVLALEAEIGYLRDRLGVLAHG